MKRQRWMVHHLPYALLNAQTPESFYLRVDVIGINFIKDSSGAYNSLSFATTAGKHTLTRDP